MKRPKKLILASGFVLSLLTSHAYAAEYHFQDAAMIPWAATSIEKLYEEHIIHGVSDTEFAPNNPVTRAEFAAMIASTQHGNYEEKNLPFTDVPKNEWYYASVKKMYSMGMIKGVSDNEFAPDRMITREEAAALFARTFDDPQKGVTLPFKDINSIDPWAYESVKKGMVKGLFAIFGDQFKPQQPITRAETAVILHKIIYGDPAPYTPPPTPPPDQGRIVIAPVTHAAPPPAPAAEPTVQVSRGSDLLQQRLMKVVQSVLGTPYVWGGDSLQGMDCSGMAQYIYKQLGVDLPRDSRDQFSVGEPVSLNDMQKGDLIFFDTGGGVISHMGIYVGNNHMVHAATKQGEVEIADLDWYVNHYTVVGVKRILQ